MAYVISECLTRFNFVSSSFSRLYLSVIKDFLFLKIKLYFPLRTRIDRIFQLEFISGGLCLIMQEFVLENEYKAGYVPIGKEGKTRYFFLEC